MRGAVGLERRGEIKFDESGVAVCQILVGTRTGHCAEKTEREPETTAHNLPQGTPGA